MMQVSRFGYRFGAVLLLTFCLSGLAQSISAAPTLTFSDHKESNHLPLARPDWPQPRDANMVFYVQRTTNRNTIVYTAQFDENGNLRSQPVHVYWRRFAEQGQPRALKWIERVFAFGVRTRRNKNDDHWTLTFAALKKVPLELRQSGPNQAALWAHINNLDYKLVYGFLDLDESGLITRVVRLRLYTFDPRTEKYVTHIISVSGGEFRE